MSVLLIRLAGPMQSWGDSSRYARRTTRREPTKSGIVGLIASALGRTREDPVDDLAQLELAVRVEQPGQLMLLEKVEAALRLPRRPLYLGRRSCPADMPLCLGIDREAQDVRLVLAREPWRASERYKSRHTDVLSLEMVADARDGEACESWADYPLTYSTSGRRYACRPVTRLRVPNPDIVALDDAGSGKVSVATVLGPNVGETPVHDPLGWME